MDPTACTKPQCLYTRAIPLLPLWAVRPVQSLSACTVDLYLYSPHGPYGLYRASVPVQGCTLPLYITDLQLTLCILTIVYSINKDSVHTAQKTHSVGIRNTDKWKVCSEISSAYYTCKKHTHKYTGWTNTDVCNVNSSWYIYIVTNAL